MRLLIILLILIFNLNLFAVNNEEFRAVWVISWDHIDPGYSAEQNKTAVRKILDDVQAANMNAVLWQARQSGTAYYNSSFEPWGKYANYTDPGYDPLAYVIEEAHKRGIEVHAWFNTFQASSTHEGTPAMEHPQWVCTDENGVFLTVNITDDGRTYSVRSLSPGLEEVRDYTVQVAMELVNNYDIDGLHLDYVRWNEYTYHPSALEKRVASDDELSLQYLQQDGWILESALAEMANGAGPRYIYDVEHPKSGGVPAGFSDWNDWRRWTVTKFVHSLHDSIQAVKPWVRLSPAALGKYKTGGDGGAWNGYYYVFQDAAKWFNEGYVDQLTPMHYHWTTGSSLKAALQDDWQPNIQSGIAAGRLFSTGPGSYILDDQGVWNNHEDIVDKIRTLSWNDGFQFYSYAQWEGYKYWETASEKFFQRKTKIRGGKFISAVTPDAPVINLTKMDSLNYQIEVTPPSGLTSDLWLALYRSGDDIADLNNDQIIDVHFGKDAYQITDTFNGLQEYNGKYHYFATTINRYWNESGQSNLEVTDSIISFAPVVIETFPAEGEELSVNKSVVLTFSKTIETSTADSAISINPPIELNNLQWSSGNKKVTITPIQNFALSTEYTLTVSADLKDVNGRALDGNGDGTPDDAYTFVFNTKDVDDMPPEFIATWPDYQDPNTKMDVKDVVSVQFDELVQDSTLNENSVRIYKSTNLIPSKLFHKVIDDRSVVSVQADEALLPDRAYDVVFSAEIADTAGNSLATDFTISFTTKETHYIETKIIEDFYIPAGWWAANSFGSGSTKGVIDSETKWTYTTATYLPNDSKRKAASLKYSWDPDWTGVYLLREFLPPTDSKNVEFDSSYTLQVYLYGDGSNNQFRFCVDEALDGSWGEKDPIETEVSKWFVIDWVGWRLIEWKLTDPEMTGSWISPNNKLTGPKCRFDSFQLTWDGSGALKGNIYLDDLRIVKKSTEPISISDKEPSVPLSFSLGQNYPNPFNPLTQIEFSISSAGQTKLFVYNIIGQIVDKVVDKVLQPGSYQVQFNGSKLASGTYIYELRNNRKVIRKRMVLLK